MDRRDFLKTSVFSAGGLMLMGVGGSAMASCEKQEENGMVYRTLGRTGIRVSAIALGCEGFGRKTKEQVREEFTWAIKRGVNFLDLYSSNPELRENIGYALKGRRNKFVIQGHIGSAWKDGQYYRTRDVEAAKDSFEKQLKALNTNYIDVGMIHYVDEQEDFDEIFGGPFIEYVKQLRKKRSIRSVGLSTHNPSIAMQAAQSGLVDVLMFSLNPSYDFVFEDGKIKGIAPEREALYEYCEKEGIAIDVMKVFGGGNLLKDESSPIGKAFTPVQCLEYVLTRPAVAAAMCGVYSLEQLESDLTWCTATPEEKDFVTLLADVTSSDWKGHCTYCTHCAPCTVGINIADVNKYLNLAKSQGEVPETVQDHYNLLAHHGSECIECGKCEGRCPFEVPIIANMREAAKVFGI